MLPDGRKSEKEMRKSGRKIFSLFLILVFLFCLWGCSKRVESGKTRIAVITKSTTSAFWKSVYAGVRAASVEYNVNITFDGPETEEDYEKQNMLVHQAMEEGVDAIVFSAVDYNASAGVIDQAAQQGIKVIVIDSDVNSTRVSCRIGTDNYEAGGMAGRAALETDGKEL